MNNVMILVGAGQIGLAIARRTGSGKTIVIADKNRERRIQRHGGDGGSRLPRLHTCTSRQGAASRPGDHACERGRRVAESGIRRNHSVRGSVRHGHAARRDGQNHCSWRRRGHHIQPLAIDEFNGPRGAFYKDMFARCPAGRPGTPDEIANLAELLLSDRGSFITGADFLADGGATASWYYGPLRPNA